ncbi:MAG TPA: UvrD-helicase domain-containing protein [Ignavibacteriaceae bacterium]|nr:UvrD-helicase domain-containing protein [Ignavibacteriaceae bacterium]
MNSLTSHQQKALTFDKHVSLTANAGSGKTFVLSRRFLEIAIAEKGSLKKIAAITFTDKAAGELYRKIADEVERKFTDSTDQEEKNLFSKIRRQLVSANIATIHSFCIDVLKQFPVEAGLDANFRPVDEITSNELIELSVEETLKESLSDRDADETRYLVRFAGSKLALSRQLIKLIKERKKVLLLREEFYNQSVEKIAAKFYDDFCETAEILIQRGKDEFINALTAINEAVLAEKNENSNALEVKKLLIDFRFKQSAEEKINILGLINGIAFTGKGKVRDNAYLTKSLRDSFIREISITEKYIGELSSLKIIPNHKEIENELARFGLAIINLFTLALAKYDSAKKENGYLDYEDILILTKNILMNPSVKVELSKKFRYIMVDEYQDTNEIQYKIFLPILDNLREGNLFVVGDEKQSIYMFRDAELEVFKMTKKNISDVSGENFLLTLPDSFRMAPGICLFVNELFRNLFSDPIELFNEVTHSDLVCAKMEDTQSLIEIIIGADEKNENAGNDCLSEAELVAGRIISLINGIGITEKLNLRDVAVLVRKRKSFASLEKTFIEKNIPFNIVGGKGFYQRQSVYDIYNYFSFLLDNKNDAALVGILRSPFFSVSDSIIYEVSLDLGETLWHKLIKYSKENEKLKRAAELLEMNILLARTYSPSQILRKILSESPYLSVLSQKAAGEQEVANISKLVRLTIDFQGKGFKTLYDYVNFLKESIEETEDEAQAAIADESDSVKIMTLHQAKGLEYPAVFLFNAQETTVPEMIKKGDVLIDKKFGLLTRVPSNDFFGKPDTAPVNLVSNIISSKKETAEIKRLFYVGATRAKNYLFISAPESKSYKDNSFMKLLLNGLNIDLGREEFILENKLSFLKKDNDQLINFSENLSQIIKIRRNLSDIPEYHIEHDKINIKPELLTLVIKDLPEGEFITATKFAVFKQCPLKYHLTFDYGVSGLISGYKKFLINKWNKKKIQYDFNIREKSNETEEEEKHDIPSELRGSIFHKILQSDRLLTDSEEILRLIGSEAPELKEDEKTELMRDIKDHLEKLSESPVYKKISVLKKFYNEYEIYLNEKDYFLHGIIDKLILENDKAIIVDYKTDDLDREEICDHAEVYFPQLKFYSYIISRFYKDLTSFELRIIFLKFPDEEVVEVIDRKRASQFGNEIEQMVIQIRSGEFTQNLSHCKNCSVAVNNKCIVDWL